MADIRITCKKCGHRFLFDEDHLDEFRCKDCGCAEFVKLGGKEQGRGQGAENSPTPETPDHLSVRLKKGVDGPWWVYPLVFIAAVAVTALLYYVVFPQIPSKYWRDLWLDRGWFQPLNTWVFVFALWMVTVAWWNSRTPQKSAEAIDRVARSVREKWASNVSGGSVYDRDQEKQQRNQGQDLLEALGPEAENIHGLFFQRIYRIGKYLKNTRAQNLAEMMDINRDLSSLDQETLDGRFTFVRYAVYLMPVIGFLGTVWGISEAMVGIGNALPAIKDLQGFIGSLGSATKALQIAFDTTLLALLYSGLMTLLLTLANSRSGSFLSELDTWVIDNVLSHVTEHNATERTMREGFTLLAGADGNKSYAGGLAGLNATMEHIHKAMPAKGSGSLETVVAEIGQLQKKVCDTLTKIRDTQSVAEIQNKILATIDQVKKQLEKPAGADLGQVTRAVEGVARSLESIQTAQTAAAQQIRQLTDSVAKLPDLLGEIAKHVSEVHKAQVDGHENVQRLTGAVSSLPNFADKLEAAAQELSRLGSDLEHNRLAGISETLQQVAANTARIQLVRDALAKDVDGKTHDTITAITTLSDVLGEKMHTALQHSAEHVNNGLQAVADSNAITASKSSAAIKEVRDAIDVLSERFLQLANILRQSQPRTQ
jgi:biopolymer transport protein ExbB/TolQ